MLVADPCFDAAILPWIAVDTQRYAAAGVWERLPAVIDAVATVFRIPSILIANQLAFRPMLEATNQKHKLIVVVRRLPDVETPAVATALEASLVGIEPACGCVLNSKIAEANSGKPSNLVAVVEVYAHDRSILVDAAEIIGTGVEGLGTCDAYLVREHLPTSYDRDWHDGTPTPGIRMMSLCHRIEGATLDQFEDYWTRRHAPLAMSFTVPTWKYSINIVDESLGEQVPELDGMLGMQFHSMEEWRDRYIGHPDDAMRGAQDAKNFMNMERTEMFFATEKILRTLEPRKERTFQ